MDKLDKINLVIVHVYTTIVFYIIVYLFHTFRIWEWQNPFLWIVNLPTYTPGTRDAILLGWIFYTAGSLKLWYEEIKKDREK